MKELIFISFLTHRSFASCSLFASPIVLVKKKDEGLGLYVSVLISRLGFVLSQLQRKGLKVKFADLITIGWFIIIII